MTALTDRQKREFARNGFLVLDDALPAELVAEARGAVKGDPSVEAGNQNEPAGARDVFRELNRELFAYADALVGGEKLKHPDDPNFGTYSDEQARVGINEPGSTHIADPEADAERAIGVHVDDQTDGDGGLDTLNAGTYLDRVAPRAGGFTVWPGSHWTTAEHCELEAPNEDAPPGTRERAPGLRIRPESRFDSLSELAERAEPFEIAGDAGTVVLWHGGLVHSGGINRRPGRKRMAAFTRFHATPGNWDPADRDHPFGLWDGVGEGAYGPVERTRSE